jgi:AraC-like DNA-binding protein
MPLIRGTSLQGFRELSDELGGSTAELLAAAHLRPEAIGDPDSFVSYRSVAALLESAATGTATGDFGRRLAERQGLDILGPVGIAARTAPTVGAAVEAIERYLSTYSPALSVAVRAEPGDRLATFDWRLAGDRPPPHRQAAELGLGVSVRVFRLLAGEDFRPTSVHLRHEPLVDVGDYERYFGCRIDFAADSYGFRFQRDVLSRPLAADHAVHDVVQEYLSTISAPAETSTVDAVVRLVARILPTGGLDLDLVAGHLAQHRRTLQRQLADQGTTFAELVDRVRREEAERCLRDTDLAFGELSRMLGFSEQSAFSRACRRWFDGSPRTVRTSLRAGRQA